MKTIFITGASSGIGKETAKYFAQNGRRVIATMRNLNKAGELLGLENVVIMPLDLTNSIQIKETCSKAIKEYDVDVLFNNAGYGIMAAFERIPEEDIKKLNYKSCPSKEDIPRIIKELQSEGLSLEGIPGFYKRFGKKYTMMLANGFFVPFHSYKGYIQGLQIRRKGDENVLIEKNGVYAENIVYTIRVKNQNPHKLNLRIYDHFTDEVFNITHQESCHINQDKHQIRWEESFNAGEEKCFSYTIKNKGTHISHTSAKVVVHPRYIWFTSGNRNGGAAAKNDIHFVGKLREVMYITEGALKADVTYCLSNYKKSFLAVTGVTCLNKLGDVFAYYKKKGVKEIRIALDMDRVYNHVVMESIEKIQKMVEDAGMTATVLEWDGQMGKGIDDFTLEYLIQKGKKNRSVQCNL